MHNKPEVVCLFSAYVFEPFVRQSLIALINSHQLVIVDDEEKLDLDRFPEFLQKYGITYLNGTASVLQEYNLTNCTSLSKLILIGEEFTESRCKKLRQNYNGRIINEYGFTESALVTAMKIFDPDTPRVDRTIGKPLRNVKCYILDKDLKQLPLQTIGELHIGGMGISRGYLNRPHLTDDKFIPNPYQTREEKDAGFNSKMYKTGDLARWTANGEVEYIGRNDFQIKLRGVRIEPAEIESIVMKYEGLKKCTIVVKSTKSEEESTASSKHLVGYFVVGDGIDISEHELIMHLEKNLPRYMIPARMVQVKDIPVTINGKIDFRSLPNVVDLGGDQAKLDYTPPRNEMESKLCQIWGETLNLKKTRVGITDDFFRLGGHSITCIQLIAKIRQQLKIHITLEQIFKLRTIQKLADSLLEDENHNDLLAPNDSISAKDDDTIIPANHSSLLANSLQQGLMYHHMKQLDTPDDAYIMQSLYKYETPLDILHYKKSWKAAQQKYVSLRLNFRVEKEIYQVVNHEQELSWNYKSLKDLQPEEQELKISQAQKADREKGYRLESESLFRIHLFELKQNSFILLFSCHHVIIDGWSFPILFSFVHEQYLNLLHGSGVAIPSARSDSIDEAYLQAQFYLQSHRKDNLSHWTKQVEKIENRSNLSVLLRDEVRYQTQLNDYDRVQDQRQETVEFGPELVSKLKTISGITLHSILQFVWHKVLHVYGSGRQTIVGTTVSGRNLPIDGIERSVGLYINTLPLIVDHAEQNGLCVLDALELIQGKVIEMNSRSNIELGSLHNNTGLKHGLFDTLFVLENYPNLDNSRVEFQRKELGFKFLSEVEKLDYPLAVIVREVLETKEGGGGGGGLKFTLCYAGELFDLEIVQDLLALVTQLLWQIVDSPESKLVTKLNCLLPKHESLLDGWNNCTRQQFPRESTLHKIFEQVAHKFPDKVAVTYENVSLTYAQLNKRANQLANYLKNLTTIRPNDKVALILNKNELMILSVFGVWKSGAAYVPVDPSYPDERIQFILKDTQAKIIITNSTSASRVQTLSCSDQCVIQIEEVSQQRLHNLDSENPTAVSTCTDLAYIIYTSGTTGNPKGVMIEHRGVVNLQNSLAQIFSLQDNHDEVILSFSNYVFDHFVEQMVDALLNGQTLVVLNDEMRCDKDRLYEYMRANKVTYLSGTPSVLSLYEYRDLPHLKRIDAVGEDFSEPLFNKIRSTFSGLIINGYGPTEVSITSHKRLYPDPSERRLNKSIGHPVGNTTCYILDENMQRLPSGAIGDLYLGGVGVGRGYLNRDDLTDKAFVRNPFADGDEDNARLYKTGDLCRFLSNGEVDYMGRNDFQVKVHGLRIELCEIEAAMLSYPPGSRITQCVVISRNQNIIGYYVSPKENLEEVDIRKYLQTKLPGYMVPKRLVPIDKIPVNISGKVDTKQLSQPVMMERLGFSPPQNELETKLCTIWGEILQLPEDQIGITDDFFGLGGDSLLAISLSFTMTKSFGKSIQVTHIFEHRTIQGLGKFIESKMKPDAPISTISQPSEVTFELSLAQKRLLFINEMENGTSAFNVPFYFELSKTVNLGILQESIRSVIKRHEILRTLILTGSNKAQVIIREEDVTERLFSVDTIRVENHAQLSQGLTKASQYIFSLDKELPLKVTIYEIEDTPTTIMCLVFHHICFDGWSWGVFQRDLKSLYANNVNTTLLSKPNMLPPLTSHYKEFASWENNFLTGQRLQTLSNYWKNKLDSAQTLNFLPDFQRPSKFSYKGKELRFHISLETTRGLKELSKMLKTSMFSVLISAYSLTLSYYTNQKDILIGYPVSNRNLPEFENVIGFFVNLLPLRSRINPEESLAQYIRTVGEEIIQSQAHQDMLFDKLVSDNTKEIDLSRHPLVQVIFSFNPTKTMAKHSLFTDQDPLKLNPYEPNISATTAKYDLSTTMTEVEESGIEGTATFATKLFRDATIENFLKTYAHVLEQFSNMVVKAGVKISDVNPVGKLETASLLTRNTKPSQDDNTPSSIFDEIATKFGYKTALVSLENGETTYSELSSKANQLAYYLLSKFDPKPDDIIALFLDKSEPMISSILAVWKTGAAYVPIDPEFPSERISFILKDTKAKILLTSEKYGAVLRKSITSNGNLAIVEIDSASTSHLLNLHPTINFKSEHAQINSNLSYIIYTSGTTGNPKGVMIEQKSVADLRSSLTRYYFSPEAEKVDDEGILFLSNYVFDFSIEQLLLGLFSPTGNKLILPPKSVQFDDHDFYEFLNSNGLAYLSGTPTVLHQLDLSRLIHLRNVTVAGETFGRGHFDKIRSQFQGRLVNAYGTTETCVYNVVCRYEKGDNTFKNSLGDVLPNVMKFVLNENQQLLPFGAIGELYLSGIGLSRGYLNQENLTKCNFIPNPFHDGADDNYNAKLYKTGDLVRYLPSGELEYLGRNDSQIKIRGLRVEIGEIEAAISRYSGILHCAVAPKYDPENNAQIKSLVGYFISTKEISEDKIIAYLETKLPSYMIPSRLIRVEGRSSLPITINGKLDTKLLQSLQDSHNKKENVLHTEPQNDLEVQLCQIWASVLGLKQVEVGIDDNFFHLGGDSISSLRVVSKSRSELGNHSNKITVQDIFLLKTIRRISEKMASTAPLNQTIVKAEQGHIIGEVPLLPIQQWFFAKALTRPEYWNQTIFIKTPPLNLDRVTETVRILVNHHDAFRLRFSKKTENSPIVQFYQDDPSQSVHVQTLDVKNLSESQVKAKLSQWQSNFDLENGPLSCLAYLTGYDDGSTRIWWAIHHLIVDSVSWRILRNDFQTVYLTGHNANLGMKGSSYRDFSTSLNKYACSEQEALFWNKIIDKVPKYNELLAPNNNNNEVKLDFSLTPEQTKLLMRDSCQTYSSQLIDLLLTALGYGLKEVSGSQINYVTLEGHGREERLEAQNYEKLLQLDKTMGWFTSMYPIEIRTCSHLEDSISAVKSHLKEIPNKGIGYGATFGYHEPLASVSFNYLGQFEESDNNEESAFWGLTDLSSTSMELTIDSSSSNKNSSAIDITGICSRGVLSFKIGSYLSEKTTRRFITNFKGMLENIINFHKNSTSSTRQLPIGVEPYFQFCSVIVDGTSSSIPTLFVLPPGEGGAESYFGNIAQNLGGFNLIIFNNFYLAMNKPDTCSFEQLAKMYLKYIRELQPHGPYHFLGWSFGGLLSLEISKQLTNSGEKIGTLTMIDSYFNVIKACHDIGLPKEKYVIDRINYAYTPGESCLKNFVENSNKIALFKATRINEKYDSDPQFLLYEYYRNSKYNNLDTLIDPGSWNLLYLDSESHNSWVHNKSQVDKICDFLVSNIM